MAILRLWWCPAFCMVLYFSPFATSNGYFLLFCLFFCFFGEESWQYLTWWSDRTSLFVVSVRKFLMENDVCEPNLEQPRSSSPVFVFCRFTSLQYSQFRLCKGLQEYWHFFWQISTPHTNSPEFFWILPKFQAK